MLNDLALAASTFFEPLFKSFSHLLKTSTHSRRVEDHGCVEAYEKKKIKMCKDSCEINYFHTSLVDQLQKIQLENLCTKYIL